MIRALRRFFHRIGFALKFKTARFAVIDPESSEHVLVCHKGATSRFKRRCAHQGAPLERGRVEAGHLVCPWHGCKLKLKSD